MQIIWLHSPPHPVLWDQNPSGGRSSYFSTNSLTLKFENHWIQAIILLLAVTIFNFKPFAAYDFQHHNSISNVRGNLGESEKKEPGKIHGNIYVWNNMLHLWQ